MSKLIKNEWMKLFNRKLVIVLIIVVLLTPAISYGYISYRNTRSGSSWKSVYQNTIDEANRNLTRYSEFDNKLWENETSYEADVVTWRNTVEKSRFCIDNTIPAWDWRLDVVNQYFRNKLLLDCVRNGWNAVDLEKFFGFSQEINLEETENENSTLMEYLLSNDYQTYNKEQLAKAEAYLKELNQKAWIEDAEKTIQAAENDVEMWEYYVRYSAAPYSKSNWHSIAIAMIHSANETINKYSHLPQFDEMRDPSNREELKAILDEAYATSYKARTALTNDMPTSDIAAQLYSDGADVYDYMDLALQVSGYAVVILSIILMTITMVSEYKRETIKQLVVYPYKRTTILRGKFIAVGLIVLVLCAVLCIENVAVGLLVYPTGEPWPSFATYLFGQTFYLPYFVYLMISFLLIFAKAEIFMSVASLVSILIHSYAFNTIVISAAYAFLPPLFRVLYRYLGIARPLTKYILFGNLEWTWYLTNQAAAPYVPFAVSVIVCLFWWVALRVANDLVFKNQDIHR